MASGDDEDTSVLRETFHDLLADESQEVMIGLLGSLDQIIERYGNQEAVKSFNSSDHMRVETPPEVPASRYSNKKETNISQEHVGQKSN